MFEKNEKRDKNIFRLVIGVNVICLIGLILYMCHLIFRSLFFRILYDEQSMLPLDNWMGRIDDSWKTLAWSCCFMMIMVVVAIQTTLDLDMLKLRKSVDEDGDEGIKRVKNWLRMSTAFFVMSAVAFTLSLFLNPKSRRLNGGGSGAFAFPRFNPLTIFILGFGGLLLRFVLIYIGNRYLDWLKQKRTPARSVDVENCIWQRDCGVTSISLIVPGFATAI